MSDNTKRTAAPPDPVKREWPSLDPAHSDEGWLAGWLSADELDQWREDIEEVKVSFLNPYVADALETVAATREALAAEKQRADEAEREVERLRRRLNDTFRALCGL